MVDIQQPVRRTGSSVGRLDDMFAAHAAATPGAPAVTQADRTLSYGELHDRATRLAAHLRDRGVGPDVVVGLHVERSIDMIVAVLGILRAGGAYLPLRTDDPVERVAGIIEDSGARTVLTSAATHERLDGFGDARVRVDAEYPSPAQDAPAGPRPTTPEQLAYVIYTSGTTGAPKGVAVPHRAAARIVRTGVYADFGPQETFLQICPLSFDAHVLEVWGALANGGHLVLHPDTLVSPESVMEAVRAHGVTSLWLTPTVFNQVVDEGLFEGSGLRQVVVGGEVLSTPHLARAMRTTDIRFSNGYGPTEAGVFTCCRVFEDADLAYSPPPVGSPLPGTFVWVVDAEGKELPEGELGELYIGGDALAHGYHGRPDLTEKAFIAHPFGGAPDERVYRSGDLARMLPGGLVQVIGRIDSQVKIRGNRVELTEVESALLEAPEVKQAAVVDRQQGSERVLAAYVVPADGETPTVAGLRGRLARRLPDYMIPSELFRLDRIPLTGNGKADRGALREAGDGTRLDLGVDFRPAATDVEGALSAIWAGVLGTRTVGVDDNYFDLGGTSVSIARAHQRIQQELGITLPLVSMFEYPTVRLLADAIANSEV
ncbi:non-ribosomal peptide synthetase [Streptomyces sp. SPB4]|uniref:non-ribosomal peptide synthetase n=1 Tax=Streptomyces sp. SPB4 TaxID=2940553 RepID=UPI00247477E8|nr:non-ribosomal peptide synthetase [Streptomyces sp. SPB4]MDH6538081.1 amino acid adenylation domain-containing protein [Streptomyces sp. SPB4]